MSYKSVPTKDELLRDILEQPPSIKQSFSMYPRILVQVMLPYQDPGTLTWKHRNGHASVRIESGYMEGSDGEDMPCGIPYGGLGRLLFNHFTSVALLKQSPIIDLGRTFSDLLHSLNIHPTGGKYGRYRYVKNMLERVLRAKMTFKYTNATNNKEAIVVEQVRIVRQYCLWGALIEEHGGYEGEITLSPEFYEEIRRNAIPVDERVLSYFQKSPLCMDLYTWLTYKAYRAWVDQRDIAVSWQQLWEQFPTTYKHHYAFAGAAKKHIKSIQELWPDLDIETPIGRLVLHPCKPHILPR